MPPVVVPEGFRDRLYAKPIGLQAAILRCIKRLSDDPRYPGLRVRRVQHTTNVYEARIDLANRLTFRWADGGIILLNHCNHDILDRAPYG